MGIGSNVDRLMKIDSIIKKGLEDEVRVMEELYSELNNGLKQVRIILSETKFEEITEKNKESVLEAAKQTITGFIASLNPLNELDERFLKIREHISFLKGKLEEIKNTLAVYRSAKKALIDFDNNIIYGFKTTVLRDFEKDIEFNKRIEEALK